MRCKLPNSRGCGLLLLISALKNFRLQNRWVLTKQWLPTRRLVRLSKLWVALDGCVNFAPVAATWPLMLAACNPRAKIVLTGVPANQMTFYAHEVIERGLQVIGSSASNRQEMTEILAMAAGGKINRRYQSTAV